MNKPIVITVNGKPVPAEVAEQIKRMTAQARLSTASSDSINGMFPEAVPMRNVTEDNDE